LRACKDNQTADEIAAAWPEAERKTIVWAVGELAGAGYLRELFVERRPAPGPAADAGMDLDFSSITSAPTPPAKSPPAEAPNDAEERARREAEEKIRRRNSGKGPHRHRGTGTGATRKKRSGAQAEEKGPPRTR
jgi:hypothetical protein